MPYIAICHDSEAVDSAALREAHRVAHFDYVEGILDRLLVAGPGGGATNADFAFSVFIYATDDRDEAEALLHGDPYFACGLYGDVTIEPFLPAAGQWIGGKVW